MDNPAFLQNFIDGPKLPKLVLGFVGLVLIVAAGVYFVVSPLQAEIAALQAKLSAQRNELNQARAQVAELARFRRELAELEKRLVVLRDKLPTERETPGLYRTLSDAAIQAGLGVSLFQPKEARAKDYVNEIPISVTAEGGYHQLGKFFERVATLPRVVTVNEFKVTSLSKSRTSIKADLTLATYMYRATPLPAPGKPGTPAPAPPKKAHAPSAATEVNS